MNVDMGRKIYSLLSNDPTIDGLGFNVIPESPDAATFVPCITYREVEQAQASANLNRNTIVAEAVSSIFDINVFVSDNDTPESGAQAVYDLLYALGWDMDASISVEDTENRLRGREMRFSRLATSADATI